MSDFALETSDYGLEADLVLNSSGTAFVETLGLETAIYLSLFTDARAQPGDELLSGPNVFGSDRRGWWASKFLDDSGELGSRLWLLYGSKLTAQTRQRARDYALEALRWLKESGIARDIEVSTSVPTRGCLEIQVTVIRETETPARFAYLWGGQQ